MHSFVKMHKENTVMRICHTEGVTLLVSILICHTDGVTLLVSILTFVVYERSTGTFLRA